MRISDWSSDVCSSDLIGQGEMPRRGLRPLEGEGAQQREQKIDEEARRDRDADLKPVAVDPGDAAVPPVVQVGDGGRRGSVFGSGRGGGQKRKGHGDHPGQAERSSRSEEHTSELQSLMRISYAVFCLKKKNE